MKYSLTIWERITLTDILGTQRGAAAEYRKACKLLDLIELTEAEGKKVDLVIFPDGRVSFDPTQEGDPIEIDVADGNLDTFLKTVLRNKGDWMAAHRKMIDPLLEKFGIE